MTFKFQKYECQICKKISKQKSHHLIHIDSSNHKKKLEEFKVKLNNLTIDELIEIYGYYDKEKIVNMMVGMNKLEKLKKNENKIIFELSHTEISENKEYEKFKYIFKNKLKKWHNLLSGSGVTGDLALDDIFSIIMLCYLEKNKKKLKIFQENQYPITKINRLKNYFECISIKYIRENSNRLCKSSNPNDGKCIIEKIGELLSNHNITKKIIKNNDFIKCKKNNILLELINEIEEFSNEYNIFKYSDIIGISYEFWVNEYKGSGGKELGNFFTERKLMRMCFQLIDHDDLINLNINNNSTIGDEFCGTFGFPIYLKSFLKNNCGINIKSKNIYGVEFEERAAKLSMLNALFSLGTIDKIKKGDSFITNVSSHIDLSVHNVPFGKRMKSKHIKTYYNDFKEYNNQVPDFEKIIQVEANKDSVLASQMVIYKTKKMGLCIIKDGEESNSKNKSLVNYRKFICDSVNVKKILRIPSGAFSCTGTKTLCFYFVKDGNKTSSIKFQKLNEECNKIIEECRITYKELEENHFLWNSKYYIEDEELMKLKKKSIVSWKKLSEISEFLPKSKRKASYGKKKGKYKFFTSSYVSKRCDDYDYKDECIIIGTGGNPNIKIGKKFSCSADNFVIKSKYARYIYYFLKENINLLENGFHGSSIRHISKDYVKNLSIPIPENERINSTIDQLLLFDNLINSMQKSIKKHSEGLNYYMEMNIKKNNSTIEWKKLENVCEVKTGTYITKNMKIKGDYPVYGGGNISYYLNKFNRENEIVIAKDGVSIDCVRYIKNKFFLNHHGWTLNNKDNIEKMYLYYYLSTNKSRLYNLSHGSGQKGINQSDFYNLEIPLPNKLLQNEIINYCDNVNLLINKNIDSIKKYKETMNNIVNQSYC